MSRTTIVSLEDYKESIIRVAKDLMYPKEIREKIKTAKSEGEISRIMNWARMNCL